MSGGQQGEEAEGVELGSCRLQRFERSLCTSPVRDDDEPVLQIFPPFFKINCGDRQEVGEINVLDTQVLTSGTSLEHDHGQTYCTVCRRICQYLRPLSFEEGCMSVIPTLFPPFSW